MYENEIEILTDLRKVMYGRDNGPLLAINAAIALMRAAQPKDEAAERDHCELLAVELHTEVGSIRIRTNAEMLMRERAAARAEGRQAALRDIGNRAPEEARRAAGVRLGRTPQDTGSQGEEAGVCAEETAEVEGVEQTVTPTDLRTLSALASFRNALRASHLAKILHVNESTAYGSVRRLKRLGLVRARTDGVKRWSGTPIKAYEITDAGRAVLHELTCSACNTSRVEP